MEPKLFDTHAHINFNAFKEDGFEITKKCLEEGIWMINIGTQLTTSERAVYYADNFKKGVYAAVGLHPIHLKTGLVKIRIDKEEIEFETKEENFDYQQYKKLAQNPKVVAMGEIGLDYWYRPKTRKKLEQFKIKQKDLFIRQIKLAQELNLPVIIHCRLAFDDLYEIIKPLTDLKGVFHCFTGDWNQAKKALDLGFYLGFNGIIFKRDLKEVIKKIPLERVLLETDCPYLAPPQVQEQRNTPLNLKYILEEIARIRKLPPEKIAQITTANACQLFKIENIIKRKEVF
jgi:TatD DNase family protein